MRSLALSALAICAACAPPTVDLDDGNTITVEPPEPYIEIVHPQQSSTVELQDNCDLVMVVAVQIEDFELVDFALNPTPTEGEGHWHIEITGDASYQPIVSGKSQTITRPNFTPASIGVTATLVNSQHQEVSSDFSSSIAEITIAAPAGVTCPL